MSTTDGCDNCTGPFVPDYGTCHMCGRKWGICAEHAHSVPELVEPGGANLTEEGVVASPARMIELVENERRYLLARMALNGEFAAIVKQLRLWGIEA